MKVFDGKTYREATGAEIEKANEGLNQPAPYPTPEERIAALEEELKAAKILLGLEV